MAYEVLNSCMLIDIGLNRSECASWVQAWGSIVAIVTAFLIARWSVNVENKRRDELAKVDAQLAVLPFASYLLAVALFFREKHEEVVAGPHLVTSEYLETLRQKIRLINLPNFDVIKTMALVDVECANALTIANNSYDQLRTHLKDHATITKPEPGEYWQTATYELTRSLAVHMTFSSKRIEKFLASRGLMIQDLSK